MNILLWLLQILLAGHTAIGAMWKVSHTAAQTMPSLSAIPDGAWKAMAVVEVLCAAGFILPAFGKRFAAAASIAAIVIAAEMILFCGLHLASGDPGKGPIVYWLIVAVLCAFVVYGRWPRATATTEP